MKKKYQLVAIDCDGTLLTDDKKVSENNRLAIQKALDMGIKVVIATGRSTHGVKFFSDIFKQSIPIILYNGSKIILSKTNNEIFNLSMSETSLNKVLELGINEGITYFVWCQNNLYTNNFNEYSKAYEELAQTKAIKIDYSLINKDNVSKVLWYDKEDKISNLFNKYKNSFQDLNVVTSMPYFLEFYNKKVSKGIALEYIANYYHIPIEETIAIGDAGNDIPMFEVAGLSIAMANSYQIAKEKAQYITSSNESDGVKEVFEKFIF